MIPTKRAAQARAAALGVAAAVIVMTVTTRADPPTDAFRSLWNGKDLAGWREVQGKPGSFRVADGAIVGRRGPGTAYWLSSTETYADFELRLEYQLGVGGNSGVFIRVPGYTGRTSREGMEIQLRDDGGKKGAPTAGDTGAVYQVAAPRKFASRPAGEWNELTIRCEGDIIKIWLNGELINDVSMAKHDALAKRPRVGYIGLSAHTHDVKFRNVRVHRLNEKGGG